MNKLNFLKAVIFLSISAVILLPAYIIFVLEPSFINFITKNTETEAIKVASHMSNLFFTNAQVINRNDLPANIDREVNALQEEFDIVKVKVFAPNGEIVFSTSSKDIGTINKNPYFHKEVASGQVYTKVVNKNKPSLEGQTLTVDVVETYVPIMRNHKFAGAFEIYYDITDSRKKLGKLLLHNKQTSIGISLCLLVAVIFASIMAYRSSLKHKRAEEMLYQANEELESKVLARTNELKKLNQSMHQDMLIQKKTEEEKEILIEELKEAIEQVKTLKGLLPICSSCQQIRDEEGKWNRIDEYIQEHTEAELTHSICPNCAKKLYPELYSDMQE